MNPKIIQKPRNNVFSAYFQGVSAYFRGVSAYFRRVSAYFRGVSAYFRLETTFQNFKTSLRNLGPLWQPGVYNDTKSNATSDLSVRFLIA